MHGWAGVTVPSAELAKAPGLEACRRGGPRVSFARPCTRPSCSLQVRSGPRGRTDHSRQDVDGPSDTRTAGPSYPLLLTSGIIVRPPAPPPSTGGIWGRGQRTKHGETARGVTHFPGSHPGALPESDSPPPGPWAQGCASPRPRPPSQRPSPDDPPFVRQVCTLLDFSEKPFEVTSARANVNTELIKSDYA